jgi:hypothetical protein
LYKATQQAGTAEEAHTSAGGSTSSGDNVEDAQFEEVK